METWSVFQVFDNAGLSLLKENLREYTICGTGECNEHNHRAALLLPPDWIERKFANEKDFSNMPKGIYSWEKLNAILCEANLNIITDLSTDDTCSGFMSEDAVECFAEIIHHLADECPSPGTMIFQLYIFLGNRIQEPPLILLAVLKRLEVWLQCSVNIVTALPKLVAEEICSSWKSYIDFSIIAPSALRRHSSYDPIWYGSLNVVLEKRSGDIRLHNYYLYLPTDVCMPDIIKELPFLEGISKSIEDSKFTFDNQIQVVSVIPLEKIPFHLVSPMCFKLVCLDPANEDFFTLAAGRKDCWFLAFLKYDVVSKKQENTSAKDWNDYLQEKFTQYIPAPVSRMYLKNHCSMLIQSTGENGCMNVYFVGRNDMINAAGFLQLLETNDYADSEDDKLITNVAEYISPNQWCEKSAWYLEENCSNIGISIARYKSDDFYMNGVMKPGTDTGKEDLKKDSFVDILSLFDGDGNPASCTFQPIPMISDRLLKNVKSEELVKGLSYIEAEKLIGHGIEYCVDSLCAIRLDNRLLKIQKRFVPEDTINLTSYNPKPPDEPLTLTLTSKRKIPSSASQKDENKSKTKVKKKNPIVEGENESRSKRHMRRLQTLVDGTVKKYGSLAVDHPSYQDCCDQLFQLCVPIVKSLTTSKGLNEQMKQIAKDHVMQVVAEVTSKNEG